MGWAQATDQPRPILWRDTEFTIPFRVHVDPSDDVAPAEIWLYVSTDHGVSWSHVATDDPQAGRFVFSAAGDGDYWFSLRIVDRFGTVRPAGPHRVELRVSVDTESPVLEVDGVKGATGEVQVRWQASDEHLDSDSLTVEYRRDTDPYWQPLVIAQTASGGSDRRSRSGQATWHPVPGCRNVVVRAKVEDLAGNSTTRQVRIDLSESRQLDRAAAVSRMASTRKVAPPRLEEPGSLPRSQPARDPYAWTADQSSDVPLDRWLAGNVGPMPPIGPSASIAAAGSTPPILVRTTVNGRQGVPTGRSGIDQQNGTWSAARRHVGAGEKGPDRSPPADHAADPAGGRGPGPQADPPILKVVRSKIFEIDYRLPPAGRDQMDRLELWATTDSGKSWRPVEATVVGRESLRVSVDHEGLYGFRIVSVRPDGHGEPAPVPGDHPDVWVHVDWSPPVAKIVSVELSADGSPGTLLIRWEATDRRLALHPVTLYYRWNVEQTWSPIAVDLENTGQFAWRTGLQGIGEIEVRLDVRDFAGNVTTVSVAREADGQAAPAGRIFRSPPIDRSAQRYLSPHR